MINNKNYHKNKNMKIIQKKTIIMDKYIKVKNQMNNKYNILI